VAIRGSIHEFDHIEQVLNRELEREHVTVMAELADAKNKLAGLVRSAELVQRETGEKVGRVTVFAVFDRYLILLVCQVDFLQLELAKSSSLVEELRARVAERDKAIELIRVRTLWAYSYFLN
jgi:hypothetical protein